MKRWSRVFLSKDEIIERIKEGDLVIDPFEEGHVGPDSVDLSLDGKFLMAKRVGILDGPKDFFDSVDDDEIILRQGDFVLGSTLEKVGLPNDIVGFLHGRSSLGRMGIMVHVTAGIVHAGFGHRNPSKLTLEIYSVNPNPVVLKKGMRVAQIAFARLGKKTLGYDYLPESSYTDQDGPRPPSWRH